MPRVRLSPAVAVAALSAGVLWFYLWTASDGRPFPWGAPQDGHYNLLAQALVRGQLHLAVEPRPELFELVDPYDPAKNAPYRLHDASLYRGRYYLYFGLAPALVLFVPFRLLGIDLPEGLAAVGFAFSAFVLSGLLFRRLVRDCAPTSPVPLRLVGLLVLALTNGMPFVLRGSAVYEVAITAGACFLWASALCFAGAGDEGRARLGRLALGSLFLGLAVGSRPSHVFAAPLLLALGAASVPAGAVRRTRVAIAGLAPFGAVLLLLALYNAARYSSPFQFGIPYQLSGNHPHGLLWQDPRGILPGLYFNFLAPPALRLEFPFVFLERRYPWTLPPGYFGPELIAGVFLLAPFVLILLAARPLLRSLGSLLAPAPLTVALLAAIGFLNPLVTSFLIGAANQRYEADFVSFLVVPALVVWLVARERFAPGSRARLGLAVGMGAAACWASFASLALSLTGYEYGLERANPALFGRLEQVFEPWRVGFGRAFLRDGRAIVRFRMALPDRPSAEVEPLVSSGSPAGQDVLYVRTLGPGLVSFVLGGPAPGERACAPVLLRTGHFHSLEVDLDRVRRQVLVRIDDRDPIRIAGDLGPVVPGRVWLGRGAKGKGATDLGRFSGALVSEVMEWARAGGASPLPDILPLPTLWGQGTSPPPAGEPGQLWASAVRDGAFLRDGARWRWVARHSFDRLLVRHRLNFAERAADAPVLAWGDASVADVVAARATDSGRFVFSYGRWPLVQAANGPAIPIPRGPAEVTVLLDRPAGRVHVTVAGQTALEASADLLPIERGGIYLGRLPRGFAPPETQANTVRNSE